jgi:hypothetical protein
MRRSSFVLLLMTALWIVGCQKNLPVELAPEQNASALAVKVLPVIDPTLIVDASVDTSGVLQSEEQTYPATLLVNGVKTDFGTSRSSFSFSRILINDKLNRITDSTSKVIGYLGLDVGNAKVNTIALPKAMRPMRTYTSFQPQVSAGPAYTLVDQDNEPVPSFVYTPAQSYRFVADGKGRVSSFQLAIQSPDEITVVEPKAGSIAFRSDDLHVSWNGKHGDLMRVLISSYDSKAVVPVQPLIEVTIQEGDNSIIIPAKVLQALQANRDGQYLFSFVSSNRTETNIPGYADNVLVQASSIHNILLWLK